MRIRRHKPPLFFLCLLLCLLTACGTTEPDHTPTKVEKTTPAPTVPAATPTEPSDCPPDGTARPAIIIPLTLGNHQTIVYISDTGPFDAPDTYGIASLKRYDVGTGTTTNIASFPKVHLDDALVSADGQWILFDAIADTGLHKLQLIRLDGQSLQTLYCQSQANLQALQWSSDQKYVVFMRSSTTSKQEDIELLNLQSGTIQIEFSLSGASYYYQPVTWLDHIGVYVGKKKADGPDDSFALLDIRKGPNQTEPNLLHFQVASTTCTDFDSSYDSTQLFVSSCYDNGPFAPMHKVQGPSSIIVESPTGGQSGTIYGTSTLAITAVRSISHTTLLFTVNNLTGDTTHNGLWKINRDGTSLVRLTTDSIQEPHIFNIYSQNPWSNVSRDGSKYVLTPNGLGISMLLIGSLHGGTPTELTDSPEVSMVGWTTM
jgi:eukaryotic-like serine/threonine-protein kinase